MQLTYSQFQTQVDRLHLHLFVVQTLENTVSNIWILLKYYVANSVSNLCCNDEVCLIYATMMSLVGCLLTDSELFILFAENSQILLKISGIPILLTLFYLVALNQLVSNQLNSSFNSTHHCST